MKNNINISFRNAIQSLCHLELIFIVKPRGLHVLLGEIGRCIYILCDFLFTKQTAISFSINILINLERYSKDPGSSPGRDTCFFFKSIRLLPVGGRPCKWLQKES